MILALTIIFFLFGLIIGSFLNVVICRYNARRFGGRSACMSCQKQLCWHELIPLFSFICQKGRCRGCQGKISWQYPVVEFLTGVIFAALFLKFQPLFWMGGLHFALSLAYYGSMFSLLMVIAVYDLRHKIIPDKLSLIFAIIAFAGLFLFQNDIFSPHWPTLSEFFAGLAISVPFALVWLLSRGNWMGLGDAKLAVGLGWMLGLSRMLSGVVISFWSGAIIGVILLACSRAHTGKSEVPFAPFLVFGAIIAFLFELHLFPLGF